MHENSPLWEALQLWSDITGVKPPEDDHDYSGMTFGNLSIRDSYVAIKEALELDPSEITATLLFKHFVEAWAQEATATMAELLKDPAHHLKKVDQMRQLLAILDSDEIKSAREAFVDKLTAALTHYGAAGRKDVLEFLDKPSHVAVLRRDALRSLERLRVDQFLKGDPEPEGTLPGYITVVHEWWNINSLLAATTSAPSAVSLNLIRDPNDFECFFCFAIRNGANLFVLSDVAEYAHPLGAQMSRRPDRHMAERINKNWFPYDLLDIKLNEKGEIYFSQWSDTTSLVPYQGEANPLKKISEIKEPAELVWIVMMLELIVDKFWRQSFQAKQLSYTGEMVRVEGKLLEHAQRAGLPVVAETIAAPELTLADVSADNLDEAQIGPSYDHPNRWMEERYKAQVPAAILNLIAPPGKVLFLDHKSGEVGPQTKAEAGLPFWEVEKLDKVRTSLVQLPATRFGTPERLEADRRWIARYNLAEHIHDLAGEEYTRRETEIREWFTEACKTNLPTILTWVPHETLWVDVGAKPGATWHHSGGHGIAREGALEDAESWLGAGFDSNVRKRLTHTFMRTFDLREKVDLWDSMARCAGISLGGDHYRSVQRTRTRYGVSLKRSGALYDGPSCAVTGAKASYVVMFYPTMPEELAALAGVEVDKLPDVLQHWSKVDRYTGNSILQRIDPMVWNAKNPWLKMELRIRVPLSLRGMVQVKKTPSALPPLPIISEGDAKRQPGAGMKFQLGGKR